MIHRHSFTTFSALVCLIANLIFLPGCMQVKSYKHKPLRSLSSYITYQVEQDNIIVYAKQYDRHDCMQLFGSRGARLVHHKHATSIYPIQISIKNDSKDTWVLNKNSVNLKLTPYHQVAHRIQNHTVLRIVGIVAVGAAFTALTAIGGTALLGIGIFTWSIPAAVAGGALCASVPFMLLVNTPMTTTVKGVQSLRTNTRIKHDMKKKTLVRSIIIEPEQSIDTLLFVKGVNYKPEFNVMLYDKNNTQQTKTFTVKLEPTIMEQDHYQDLDLQSLDAPEPLAEPNLLVPQ